LLGPARLPDDELDERHKDIAYSAQAVYEEAFFHLLEALQAKYQCDAVAIAGGCGQNSVANGKIHLRSSFKTSYLPPATPDAGGAIGAAAYIWHTNGGASRTISDDAFVGPAFSDDYIVDLVARHRSELERLGCTTRAASSEKALCGWAAEKIAAGNVVGWFQGRMEIGPRALGNRSIICDPRRADMKTILNRKIKRRESFRPFAPSVLRAAVPEWFESDDDVPFMSKVFMIREEKRQLIPAVTHVDGSGRLQTVRREENPLYFDLISEFGARTGVPMVLNTSFNENEPIVCRPEEALHCFLRTEMDVLVLSRMMIERRS
jgi:carbamoyltransferase